MTLVKNLSVYKFGSILSTQIKSQKFLLNSRYIYIKTLKKKYVDNFVPEPAFPATRIHLTVLYIIPKNRLLVALLQIRKPYLF